MADIKYIISTQLTNKHYSTWRSQTLKLFRANRFVEFLDGTNWCLENFLIFDYRATKFSQEYDQSMLVSQNLATKMSSTISFVILPYIL